LSFSSIRVRLAVWYFGSLAVILALFAVAASFAMEASMLKAVNHDLRVRMADVQQFIDRQLATAPDNLPEEFAEEAALGLGGSLLEVRDGTGRVLYRSARLGNAPLGGNAGDDGIIRYSTERVAGAKLRVAAEAFEARGRFFTVRVAEPMHEFEESRERFEAILAAMSVPALLLAALGGFWLSGRALAPVDRITHEARRISISNLGTRLEVPPARDELQRLVLTVNQMLERLDGAVKRMVQFTADASHELRAPLTLIHTAAEFSLRRERTREELLDAMRKIARESDRTSRLVDDMQPFWRSPKASVWRAASPRSPSSWRVMSQRSPGCG
jgi:methyl-accepting chemotaxis protein